MSLHEEILRCFAPRPVERTEKDGRVTLACTVAERRSFLSRRKLVYRLAYRIDEGKRTFRFTERLETSGWGLSGSGESAPGFGFRKGRWKTGAGPREETLEERSNLLGQRFDYRFDFEALRGAVTAAAEAAGYAVDYRITPFGW